MDRLYKCHKCKNEVDFKHAARVYDEEKGVCICVDCLTNCAKIPEAEGIRIYKNILNGEVKFDGHTQGNN